MIRPRVQLSEIKVGETYYYQGANTMEKNQIYEAEVLGIYQHHIVMAIKPAVNVPTVKFTEIQPYRWSISKISIGQTEHLFRRNIA